MGGSSRQAMARPMTPKREMEMEMEMETKMESMQMSP